MGRKAGKYKKKESSGLAKNKSGRFVADDEDMMNDEIDAFHKNRDVVPLNINEDTEESDEDNEHPVFDFEDDKDDDEEDDDEDADVDDDDKPPKGLAAKIVRTQKYLRSKFPGIDDEMLDEAEEEEEERDVWGKKKDMYYEVKQITIDDEDEDEADEEAEVLRLQREKAKVLSMKDFGIEDASEDEFDMEPTFEEILSHGKSTSKDSIDKGVKDDDGMSYEIVKKDLNALTKEEQMDVVYSSAPELVGLLSELKDALKQLENKVNPLANKILGSESAKKGGMHYFVVKQLLLQSFCQAIAFYLLLKSEGQQVRDHPVVSRLVEIKNLLDKMKELDENLPVDLENFVNKDVSNRTDVKLVEEIATARSDSLNGSQMLSSMSSEKQAIVKSDDTTELNNLRSLKNSEPMHKNQDKQEVGVQSREMLKVRAALEEKLRQKGVFSSIAPKNITAREHLQPVNRQLETLDDFDDEAMEIDGVANGRSNGDVSGKNSQQLTLRSNKRKVISGDDDVPRRDDIGERRRKHELRVLAGAGIQSFEDVEDETAKLSSDEGTDVNSESDNDSDLEYYKQVEQQLAAKLAAKSDKYSRTPEVSSLPDAVVDGKRNITRQIEKNRGLTRARKKLTKNPRKKYKLKHKKAEVRRKGQVREIRKPAGPYGGEASGINAGISRSIRFKS